MLTQHIRLTGQTVGEIEAMVTSQEDILIDTSSDSDQALDVEVDRKVMSQKR